MTQVGIAKSAIDVLLITEPPTTTLNQIVISCSTLTQVHLLTRDAQRADRRRRAQCRRGQAASPMGSIATIGQQLAAQSIKRLTHAVLKIGGVDQNVSSSGDSKRPRASSAQGLPGASSRKRRQCRSASSGRSN